MATSVLSTPTLQVSAKLGSRPLLKPVSPPVVPVRSREALNAVKKIEIRASMKEKAVTGLTAVALTAALVIPEVAEAAQPGMSASLKNFLFSIAAGGVVLSALAGAVIGVSNFDPVKRS